MSLGLGTMLDRWLTRCLREGGKDMAERVDSLPIRVIGRRERFKLVDRRSRCR
jgi:hypothetical protein